MERIIRPLFAWLLFLPSVLSAATDADRPLMVIVDLSRNINVSDPHHYTVDAVQLAVATLRSGKEMEVIGFSDDAAVLLPWNGLPTLAERVRVRDLLTNRLQFTGVSTHYLSALILAWSELDLKHAPPGTRVIFFTDGPPTDDPAQILAQASRFADRGWVIDSVRLVSQADDKGATLERMSSTTRGSHADVVDAKALIERFVEETSEENDYFLLDVHQWLANAPVVVPTGTDRFCLLNVTNTQRQHRGDFTAFARDNLPVVLDESTSYRYPRADLIATSGTSLGCVELFAPPTGAYTSSFDGNPRTIYISLALGARVLILPIPSRVEEGATITPGVSLVIPNVDAGVLATLAAQVTVAATISDGGTILLQTNLTSHIREDRVTYSQDWRVLLDTAADRNRDHHLTVAYHVIDQTIYHLDKHDQFAVKPNPNPLPPPAPSPIPTITWGSPSIVLPPCWSDRGTSGTLPLTASGPTGNASFTGSDGFTFPTPIPIPGSANLAYAFQSNLGGRHHGAFPSTTFPSLKTPDVTIDNYPWAGKDAIDLTSPGPTGIPAFSPEGGTLAPQPLNPFTAVLQAADHGSSATVAVDAAGNATFSPAISTLPLGTYSGTAILQFGVLPARSLALSLHLTPTPTVLVWDKPRIVADESLDPDEARMDGGDGPIRIREPRSGSWQPATWIKAKIPMALQSGMPGTWKVVLGDLTGPEKETLTAAYDLRASIDQPHLAAGDATLLRLRVLQPRKTPPGDYTGQLTIVFSPDHGDPQTFTRPVVVTLP